MKTTIFNYVKSLLLIYITYFLFSLLIVYLYPQFELSAYTPYLKHIILGVFYLLFLNKTHDKRIIHGLIFLLIFNIIAFLVTHTLKPISFIIFLIITFIYDFILK